MTRWTGLAPWEFEFLFPGSANFKEKGARAPLEEGASYLRSGPESPPLGNTKVYEP